MDNLEKIPVWLISGFLGSGKTTIINDLIGRNPAIRFYLIENEIGEISIDGASLRKQIKDLVEVSGGCICCTMDYAFRDTLAELSVKIRQERNELQEVALIIETSGLADPSQIRAALLSDPLLQSQFVLKSLVTCLNVVQAELLLSESSAVQQLAARQITAADILILTRVDKVNEIELNKSRELVEYWNPWAVVLLAYSGVLSASLLECPVAEKPFQFRVRKEELIAHASAVAEVEIFQPDYDFDLMAFIHRMTVLCKVQGEFLYRIKGWIRVGGDSRKFWVQSAGSEFVVSAGEEWNTEVPSNMLVFIGRGLQRAPLERVLAGCRVR